ncbi:hypothetical protein LINPERHAP2_LOCUS15113 [Linum perenne]
MTISSSISRVVVGVNRFTFLSYLVFSLPSLALLKSPWCPGFFSVLAGSCFGFKNLAWNNVAAIIEAARRLRLGNRIFPRNSTNHEFYNETYKLIIFIP